jgi:hypothetical protein
VLQLRRTILPYDDQLPKSYVKIYEKEDRGLSKSGSEDFFSATRITTTQFAEW